VRSLLDHGADLNAQSWDQPEEGLYVEWTPLHAAIYNGHRDIVLLLLEHGADPEILNSWDRTALHEALDRGCVDIVRHLINHGADPNTECEARDWNHSYVKWTPLHMASWHGSSEIARILLEHGVNPNALDRKGRTTLHLTSENTDVELFLEYGVNVDVRDEEGWTPLHSAAYNLNLEVVVALMDRGADPHAQTNDGKTPFQLANAPSGWGRFEDQAQIIQLLSEGTGERI
jgi:cytohesin